MTLTAIGVALGIPTGIMASRGLRALLFGVSETDPLVACQTRCFSWCSRSRRCSFRRVAPHVSIPSPRSALKRTVGLRKRPAAPAPCAGRVEHVRDLRVDFGAPLDTAALVPAAAVSVPLASTAAAIAPAAVPAATTAGRRTTTAASDSGSAAATSNRLDYRKARPNRFASRKGAKVVAVVSEPDVSQVFDSSDSVNHLLRSVISALPRRARRVRGRHRKAG